MYPFIRMVKELIKSRNLPPLEPLGTHVSYHRCWPWDIDLWMELNNGRTLTIYDLGRIPLAKRVGLIGVLRRKGWGLTMAGASVRYRRRIRTFERIEMHSRVVGADERFIYIEQSMWKGDGECANHVLYRSAVTDKNGIVASRKVMEELGIEPRLEALPDWVQAWIASDNARPWPPNRHKG